MGVTFRKPRGHLKMGAGCPTPRPLGQGEELEIKLSPKAKDFIMPNEVSSNTQRRGFRELPDW